MTKFPTATTANQPATRVVNLRVREDIRNLIDWAAQSQGKSRSEFMIDAACGLLKTHCSTNQRMND